MQERPLFARLASQCAQLSASDGILYSNSLSVDDQDESIIRFTPLDDETFDKLNGEMMASVNVAAVERGLAGQAASLQQKSEMLSGIKDLKGSIQRVLNL
ncbi:hypothetical protein HDU98_001702 [Podochytrium sp. JEL0797]|nr:hypothetical protein HDU98_001702 [Podochytrium sp. JEL0797]